MHYLHRYRKRLTKKEARKNLAEMVDVISSEHLAEVIVLIETKEEGDNPLLN